MYRIEFDCDLEKSLKYIPKIDGVKIREKIEELSNDPRPIGSEKLSGRDGYRIRVGNYRIIYDIYDKKLIILILHISGRKEIYKKK